MSVAIDLSQLAPPAVVESLSFEQILDSWRTRFLNSLPPEEVEAFTETITLESEPIAKLLQLAAYQELLLRQRINDAAQATILAYASGTDLDHWGAGRNLTRFPGEADSDFRRRIQLSLEGITTAGSAESYIFHALEADSNVKDVSVTSPADGEVMVTVLARTGTGSASGPLIAAVSDSLNEESVRPLTDKVTVQSAEIVNFTIDAKLAVRRGPDSSLIRQAAAESVAAYVDERRKLGGVVSLSGIYAALQRPGVELVQLFSPTADIECNQDQAPYCTGYTIAMETYQ